MIKVLIADDHELVRSGIEYILASDRDIKVVGTAASGEEALEQAYALHPDIILMDINMPGMGGLEACHKIKHHHPEIRVIALSVLNDGPLPRHLLEAGVEGYLSKHSQPDEMITAIKAVSRGECYLSHTDFAGNIHPVDFRHPGSQPQNRLHLSLSNLRKARNPQRCRVDASGSQIRLAKQL